MKRQDNKHGKESKIMKLQSSGGNMLILIFLIFFLSGCATMTPTMENVTLRCKVPSIEPMKETVLAQEKGGILISIAPPQYTAVKKMRVEDTPSAGIMGGLISTPGTTYFYRRNIPYMVVEPDRLRFVITIHNRLDRVFRGAGAVIAFNIDGKVIAVNQLDYLDFLNVIVPPRGQTQVNIMGPALSSLPDKCVIGVFIYDVVTEVDAAGNPRKRSNYEWYFDFSTKFVEQIESVGGAQLMQRSY